MNGVISRIAVFEDCLRLAAADIRIAPELREALCVEADLGRLGAAVPVERAALMAGLQQTRDAWGLPEDYDEPRISLVVGNMPRQGRLAFCLGGLAGLACATTLPSNQGTERYFQEAQIFRAVYLVGHEQAFADFLNTSGAASTTQALEQFGQALFIRALASSHTLMPDMIDVERWFANLYAGVDRQDAAIAGLAEAFSAIETATVDSALYRVDDSTITLTRAAQYGASVELAALEQALAPGANRSAYGRALALTLREWHAASAFWQDAHAMKGANDAQ
jgi:hypothetical protein